MRYISELQPSKRTRPNGEEVPFSFVDSEMINKHYTFWMEGVCLDSPMSISVVTEKKYTREHHTNLISLINECVLVVGCYIPCVTLTVAKEDYNARQVQNTAQKNTGFLYESVKQNNFATWESKLFGGIAKFEWRDLRILA